MSMIITEYENYRFNKIKVFDTDIKGRKGKEIGMIHPDFVGGVKFSPYEGVSLSHAMLLEILGEIYDAEKKMASENYTDTH